MKRHEIENATRNMLQAIENSHVAADQLERLFRETTNFSDIRCSYEKETYEYSKTVHEKMFYEV